MTHHFNKKHLRKLESIGLTMRCGEYEDEVTEVMHIIPRAYCVAKSDGVAVFAVPSCDRTGRTASKVNTISDHPSCESVKLGDWCSIALLCSDNSSEYAVIEKL